MAGNGRKYPKTTHNQASTKYVNTYIIETHHSSNQKFAVNQ